MKWRCFVIKRDETLFEASEMLIGYWRDFARSNIRIQIMFLWHETVHNILLRILMVPQPRPFLGVFPQRSTNGIT